MNRIHPTAIVDVNAELGDANYIGPFCYVGAFVKLGNNNRFESYVSIGSPPEDRNWWPMCPQMVVIGDNNVFREFVTVNCGTERATTIGNGNSFLKGSHVGHDSWIFDHSTFSCGVLIGGHTIVEDNCNFGLGSVVHQRQHIGAHSMIGMNAVIPKGLKVSPGFIWVGSPAKVLKPNKIGLEKFGVSDAQVSKMRSIFLRGDRE